MSDKTEGRNNRKKRNGKNNRAGFMILNSIKWLFALIIAVIIVSGLLQNRQSKAAFDDVKQAVEGVMSQDNTTEANNQMMKRIYGLDANAYENVYVRYPSTNLGAEELILIKLKDKADENAALELVRNRLDTQRKNFDGYGVYQTQLLDKAVIESKGGYVMLTVADNSDEIKSAFEKSLF